MYFESKFHEDRLDRLDFEHRAGRTLISDWSVIVRQWLSVRISFCFRQRIRTELDKKILTDNRYKTICGPARSDGSSCKVFEAYHSFLNRKRVLKKIIEDVMILQTNQIFHHWNESIILITETELVSSFWAKYSIDLVVCYCNGASRISQTGSANPKAGWGAPFFSAKTAWRRKKFDLPVKGT